LNKETPDIDNKNKTRESNYNLNNKKSRENLQNLTANNNLKKKIF